MKGFSALKAAGVVFAFCAATAIASRAQILTTLYSFCSQANCNDGAYPYAGLIQASDGNFYGTTEFGATNGDGAVFKITPSGTQTVLYSFDGPNGAIPYAGLLQAADGNFYGTTYVGGTGHNCGGWSGCGTVFKVSPSGTLATLYSFCREYACPDGNEPAAGLIQATDGNFYGTTVLGGVNHHGTVFTITAAGALITLYSFSGPDGMQPAAGLIQATDGNFYGTTVLGGANGYGTVFKITTSGTLTTLHSFGSQPNDGALPEAGLVQASDGNFYGTTYFGGSNGDGTVFKFTPSGTLTTLHSFGGDDGASPNAAVVQASDGNFYGTAESGGANNEGTVFKMTPSGTLTRLHSFNGPDGDEPLAALVQARDGNFYGTTAGGGANGEGTVFRLVLPRPCIVCRRAE